MPTNIELDENSSRNLLPKLNKIKSMRNLSITRDEINLNDSFDVKVEPIIPKIINKKKSISNLKRVIHSKYVATKPARLINLADEDSTDSENQDKASRFSRSMITGK